MDTDRNISIYLYIEKPPSPGVDDLDNAMKDVHISTPKLAWQADGGSEVKDTMIALRCEIKGV